MALHIATKSNHQLIQWLRSILHKQRGPQAVLDSLLKGLAELGVDFELNSKTVSDTVAVLQNVQALRHAIELKKSRQITKLLAGPNIVISPKDADSIMENPSIDHCIVPSIWVRDFYLSQSPVLQGRIAVWAAGVDDPGEPDARQPRDTILIYQKNGPIELLDRLVESIKSKGHKVETIVYGKYKQVDYFDTLERSKLVIFLTQSESQGIAQQEAWMRNVPTLVWNPGHWQYNDYSWSDEKLSSPYLNDMCGKFFTGETDFPQMLDFILEHLKAFTPREYALQRFTHKTSAQNFLEILKK